MINSHPFDAIIFDHDGTLIDTESPDFRACQLLFEEYGLTIDVKHWAESVVGRMDGYGSLFDEIIVAGKNGLSHEDAWQRLKAYWKITFEDVALMPGVEALLAQLHATQIPLAIATASDRNWVNRWMGHHNLLRYFQVIATGDQVTRNKPAPDVYLFAAAQLSVPPERCLVFEDSVAGMQSAKAAGMTVVAVPSHLTKSLNFSQADAIIDGLLNVNLKWIEQLGQQLRNGNQ